MMKTLIMDAATEGTAHVVLVESFPSPWISNKFII